MLLTNLIGFIAAAVGTSLMLPQVIKSVRTKSVGDVSLGMLTLYVINCLLWLVYGIFLKAWPLIICNFIALILGTFQLNLKIKYK